MAANNFLQFCPTDIGTNLLTQSAYASSGDRTSGNKPGVASSALNNKAIRQANYITSQIAQLVSDQLNSDVLDNATPLQLLAQLKAFMKPYAPVITNYLTGAGSHHLTFIFMILSGNATVGATYSDGTTTFTVSKTISAGVELVTTGAAAPVVSGTLTKLTGTGDATLTYYAYRSALYIRIKASAAGGGGGGSSTSSDGGDGSDGGNTTFGTSLITLNGGGGGPGGTIAAGQHNGVGGTASIAAGPVGLAFAGQDGGVVQNNIASYGLGGQGGGPGGGAGGSPSEFGTAGKTNTGSGGGGAGSGATGQGGAGGGQGAYCDLQISPPAAVYAYSIGNGGGGGAAGTGGFLGSSGSDGFVEVTECFQ